MRDGSGGGGSSSGGGGSGGGNDENDDDNEYRALLERLIRSSLPELMDRDFRALAVEAHALRTQKRQE